MTSSHRAFSHRLARRHIGAPPTLHGARIPHRGRRVWVLELPSGDLCHVTPDADGLTPGGVTVSGPDLESMSPTCLYVPQHQAPQRGLRVAGLEPTQEALATLKRRLSEATRRDPSLPHPLTAISEVLTQPRRLPTLIGRGGGQTPAGDDLLLGALLGLWASDAVSPTVLAEAIANHLSATTSTSRHLLAWAINGEFPEVLVDLVRAMNTEAELDQAIDRLLVWGSTSGWHVGLGLLAASPLTTIHEIPTPRRTA